MWEQKDVHCSKNTRQWRAVVQRGKKWLGSSPESNEISLIGMVLKCKDCRETDLFDLTRPHWLFYFKPVLRWVWSSTDELFPTDSAEWCGGTRHQVKCAEVEQHECTANQSGKSATCGSDKQRRLLLLRGSPAVIHRGQEHLRVCVISQATRHILS